ncbi:unnamed protein product, partial [Rotaria magnacalcarata]
ILLIYFYVEVIFILIYEVRKTKKIKIDAPLGPNMY